MAGDVKIDVVHTTISTSGTSQDVTISGFGTPVACTVELVYSATEGNGGTKSGTLVSRGMSDFARNLATVFTEENGSAASDCNRMFHDDACVALYRPADQALFYKATATATTDGITLSWTNSGGTPTTPAVAFHMVVTLYGGADLDAQVDQVASSASIGGTVAVTGLSFEPDVLITQTHRSVDGGGYPSVNTTAALSFGIGYHNGSTIAQYSMNYGHADATADGGPFGLVSNAYLAVNIWTDGATYQQVEWTARTSTSYTFTTRNYADDMEMAVLALGLPSGHGAFLGGDTATGSTGSQDQVPDTLGWTPGFALVVDTNAAAFNTVYVSDATMGCWAITEMGANDQGTIAWYSEDGSAAMDVHGFIISGKARYLPLHDGSGVEHDAAFTEFIEDGYRCNYATAATSPGQAWVLLVEQAGTAALAEVADTMSMAEGVVEIIGQVKAVSDTMSMSEGVVAVVASDPIEEVADSISLSEGVVAALNPILDAVADSMSLAEGVVAVLDAGVQPAVADALSMAEAVVIHLDSTAGETHMAPPITRPITVWEGGTALILDRWYLDHYGDLVDPNVVTSLTAYVYDLDGADPATFTHTQSYSWGDLLTASLQVHPSGKPDANGYNFKHRIPTDWLPDGGHRFRVDYVLEMLNDTVEFVVREEVWRYEGNSEGRFSA